MCRGDVVPELLLIVHGAVCFLQAVTMAGDGYRGKMSPHTPNERFEGATVLKTLLVGGAIIRFLTRGGF